MNPSEVNPSECWTFFDRIYCISLKERSDRRALAKKQFADVGLLGRVEFVIVEKHPENRELGIFQSHMQCLQKGLQKEGQHILIFEDDVFFQGFNQRLLSNSCTALKNSPSWDAFFLGCISSSSSSSPLKNIASIDYRCLAHAYALNRPFAEQIVKVAWDGTPFDELLRQRTSASFALSPMCAFQGLEGSDNQTVAVDFIRRCLGGLPFIQRCNELYQNNKRVFLLGPLVLFVGLLILFLKVY